MELKKQLFEIQESLFEFLFQIQIAEHQNLHKINTTSIKMSYFDPHVKCSVNIPNYCWDVIQLNLQNQL